MKKPHIGNGIWLKSFLEEKGVSTKTWGTGGAKTVGHLFEEIRKGECTLATSGKRCVRIVSVAGINVFAKHKGRQFVLVEERQVFTDGRERKRVLPESIGEKLRPMEKPIAAAERGLCEELGIPEGCVSLVPKGMRERPLVSSESFPGLLTKYVVHIFETTIPAEYFKREGYVEIQKDKKTYFVWRRKPNGVS